MATVFHRVSHMELDYKPDPSSPRHGYLKIRLYRSDHPLSPDEIYIFPANSTAADHLHDIFLAAGAAGPLQQLREERSQQVVWAKPTQPAKGEP